MLQADGTLFVAKLLLLLSEAARMELMCTLIDDERFSHLAVANDRTHALVADRVRLYDAPTFTTTNIFSVPFVWLNHVTSGLYVGEDD